VLPQNPLSTSPERSPEFAALRDAKLRHLLEFGMKLRVLVMFVLTLVAGTLDVALGAEPWRTGLVVGVLALTTLGFAADLPRKPDLIGRPKLLVAEMVAIFACQVVVISLTGGVFSPFLPGILPVMFAAGMFGRSLGVSLRAPALVTLLIGAIGAVQLSGHLPGLSGLVPEPIAPTALVIKGGLVLAMCWGLAVASTKFVRIYEDTLSELEFARREVLEQHVERLRSLEQITSRVAHEIRNPLSSIKALSQLLERQGDPTGHLAVIGREVERLQDIVDRSVSFSRPMEDVIRVALDLPLLVEDVLRLCEGRFRASGIRAELVRAPDLPQNVCGDPKRLKQVLLNLVINAIEAIEAAHRAGEIRIELAREGPDRLLVLVRDNGAGIAVAPERLFEPSVSTKPEGTGLGLPISRAIAQAHGGELELVPAEGGGALARLSLPLSGPDAEAR
jgi:signal transduction histidine kinase